MTLSRTAHHGRRCGFERLEDRRLLADDTTAPTITSVDPPDGAIQNQFLETITIDFSESMQTSSFTADTFQLFNELDQQIAPTNIESAPDDVAIKMQFQPLPKGAYRLEIDGPRLFDVAGNPLGDGVVTTKFTLVETVNTWINESDGDWHTSDNWSLGVVPGPSDTVVITSKHPITITADSDIRAAALWIGSDAGQQNLVVRNSVIEAVGDIVIETSGHLHLENTTIDNPSRSVRNRGSIHLTGDNVIRSHLLNDHVLNIRAMPFYGASLEMHNGLVNTGEVYLEQLRGTFRWAVVMRLVDGKFVNSSSGVVTARPGSAMGLRQIEGDFDNSGSLEIQDVELNIAEGHFRNTGGQVRHCRNWSRSRR